MENSGNNASEHEKRNKTGGKPPGEFVSDELEEQTARFIEGVKGLAQRRKKRASEETSGPPPPGGGQRSRRL